MTQLAPQDRFDDIEKPRVSVFLVPLLRARRIERNAAVSFDIKLNRWQGSSNTQRALFAGKEVTMQLAFRNAQGSVQTNWSDYALLRDNVQHYLENGAPSERFAALHGIERAVDGHYAVLDAARLRGEVLGAWFALKKLDLESSAVSLRTHLILSGSVPPPRVRGTLLAARAGWELPVSVGSEQPLGEVLRAFVAAVLAVTETAVDGDKLVVSRERVGSKAHERPARRFPARRRAAAAATRRHSGAASRNNVRRKRDRA